MNELPEHVIEARYQRSFGRIAGYLPRNRAGVDEWLHELGKQLAEKAKAKGKGKGKKPRWSKAVAAFAALLERDGIARMYVTEMIDQVPEKHKTVDDVRQLLAALEHIVTTAPLYNRDPAKQNAFPVSSLFTYMMMTPAGEAAFRYGPINDALRAILEQWCRFLDSPESRSVLNEGPFGWLSQPAYQQNQLFQFVIPDRQAKHWGFASFNAYFHREIKPEMRPIADPDDPRVIVSANDGTVVTYATGVEAQARFWLKGQPYSLIDMLAGSPFTPRFVGGAVFQSFLSGADYHRWHAPIGGVVKAARKVEALMFSDAESAGIDTTAGTFSQGYEASVNTRGLVFIESPHKKIGMVCVMPIGITEISSVTITVEVGQTVKKGDELGFFSYGGSSLALVFEKGAIERFTVPQNTSGNQDDGPPIFVNAQIALAR